MTPYVRELIFVLWFERYWCATLFRMTQPNPLTLGVGEFNAPDRWGSDQCAKVLRRRNVCMNKWALNTAKVGCGCKK